MKTITDPDNWIVRLIGQADLPLQLILTKEEKLILQKAIEICEKAHDLIVQEKDEQTDFAWSAIYLKNVIEDYRR